MFKSSSFLEWVYRKERQGFSQRHSAWLHFLLVRHPVAWGREHFEIKVAQNLSS